MRRVLQWFLAVVLVLVGCGGGSGLVAGIGGGVGSGGTGAPASSVGAISGFGSIVVNGVRWETDAARLVLADADGLKLGMTVRVVGELDAELAVGRATEVTSAAELRGMATAIDAGAGRFSVLGIQVSADEGTVYAGGIGSLGDLREGQAVQVYGLPGTGGQLRATRVELLPGGAPVLTGTIEELDTEARTFRLGTTTVRYAGAAFDPAFPATRLANGQNVRVRTSAPGASVDATAVEAWYTVTTEEGSRVTLSGQLEGSPGALRIDGVPVDVSSASVSGGPASALVPGVVVEAAGTVRDGVLVAERVRLRQGASSSQVFTARGNVTSFQSVARFRVQGQWIDASAAEFIGGTADDLQRARVLVTGTRVEDDVLRATRVEFLR